MFITFLRSFSNILSQTSRNRLAKWKRAGASATKQTCFNYWEVPARSSPSHFILILQSIQRNSTHRNMAKVKSEMLSPKAEFWYFQHADASCQLISSVGVCKNVHELKIFHEVQLLAFIGQRLHGCCFRLPASFPRFDDVDCRTRRGLKRKQLSELVAYELLSRIAEPHNNKTQNRNDCR